MLDSRKVQKEYVEKYKIDLTEIESSVTLVVNRETTDYKYKDYDELKLKFENRYWQSKRI